MCYVHKMLREHVCTHFCAEVSFLPFPLQYIYVSIGGMSLNISKGVLSTSQSVIQKAD